jgi:hypothetical protein
MSDPTSPIPIEDIQRATGMGERAVRAWIRRLSIVPVSMRGRVHLYPSRVVSDIQAAKIQASMARRGMSLTETLQAVEEVTGVISVAEAKRRAGRRGR